MDGISWIFLFGMFTPGLIRGAFWHDSPAAVGILWVFVTMGFVVTVGWLSRQLFGNSLGSTVVMVVAVLAVNAYALTGVAFSISHCALRDS